MNKYITIDKEYETLLLRSYKNILNNKLSKTPYDLSSDGAKGYNSGWIDALKFVEYELKELEIKLDGIICKRNKQLAKKAGK